MNDSEKLQKIIDKNFDADCIENIEIAEKLMIFDKPIILPEGNREGTNTPSITFKGRVNIRTGDTFPEGRSLFEWESTGNRAINYFIGSDRPFGLNILLHPKIPGLSAFRRHLKGHVHSEDKGEYPDPKFFTKQRLGCNFKDIHIQGSNRHEAFFDIEGSMLWSNMKNVRSKISYIDKENPLHETRLIKADTIAWGSGDVSGLQGCNLDNVFGWNHPTFSGRLSGNTVWKRPFLHGMYGRAPMEIINGNGARLIDIGAEGIAENATIEIVNSNDIKIDGAKIGGQNPNKHFPSIEAAQTLGNSINIFKSTGIRISGLTVRKGFPTIERTKKVYEIDYPIYRIYVDELSEDIQIEDWQTAEKAEEAINEIYLAGGPTQTVAGWSHTSKEKLSFAGPVLH